MLRGNYAAKIDDKGRLKIPNAFRALIEKTHGSELFVTSLTGESVRLYPMPVWLALEERLARAGQQLEERSLARRGKSNESGSEHVRSAHAST